MLIEVQRQGKRANRPTGRSGHLPWNQISPSSSAIGEEGLPGIGGTHRDLEVGLRTVLYETPLSTMGHCREALNGPGSCFQTPERFQAERDHLFCASHQKAGLQQLGTKAGPVVVGKSLVFASDRCVSKSRLHCFIQQLLVEGLL